MEDYKLIKQTFENTFNEDNFEKFIKKLSEKFQPNKNNYFFANTSENEEFKIKKLGEYYDSSDQNQGETIDVLLVALQKRQSVLRAKYVVS